MFINTCRVTEDLMVFLVFLDTKDHEVSGVQEVIQETKERPVVE